MFGSVVWSRTKKKHEYKGKGARRNEVTVVVGRRKEIKKQGMRNKR